MMINLTQLRARLMTALDNARDASRHATIRQRQIASKIQHEIDTQGERFAHLSTPDAVNAFIAGQQGSDVIVKSYLSGFDRWNQAATAEGMAVLTDQLNTVVTLLTDIAKTNEMILRELSK